MVAAGHASVSELGEFALVDAITSVFELTDQVLIGPGDDAASVRVPTGAVLASTDVLVEGRHFRRDWSSAEDVGHRAVAANLADIAAMGGTATALLIGLSMPGDTPVGWVLDLARGMRDEAAVVGATVVGGDLSAGDQIVVSVSVLGPAPADPVRRDGARPGDVLALAGRIGWAAAGYAVLARGFRSPRAVVDALRRPEPPYLAGPAAASAGASAMIDVSDGLLGDLGHLAKASGVVIDVDSGALDLPEPIESVGSALGVQPLGLVLTGGDDHALAATFPADVPIPDGWRVIGHVTAPGNGTAQAESPSVTVDGVAYEGVTGHSHWR
ncbi:MAG: thiamine-phosphate kinase [Nocardioidaceae bacterium]